MSITYEDALETLQAMFQEPWTRDTLDSVLRHQRGHMENTVDIILQHGNKDPQVLINQLDAGIDPHESILQLDEQLARQLSAPINNTTISSRLGVGQQNQQSSSSSVTSSSASNSNTGSNLIGTVTVLPDDFLRVPNFRGSMSNNTLSDDEALARMLQDELFTEELRRNPDFAHLAGRRGNSAAISSRSMQNQQSDSIPFQNPFAGLATRFQQQLQLHTAGQNSNQTQSQQQQRDATANNANNNNNNIMEKLSEMGDGAKRRLQLMAAQFQQAQANIRNNASNSNNNDTDMSFASASSSSNNNNAGERRSLLFDDTDDMELAARKDL